jgi:hypothetical protein
MNKSILASMSKQKKRKEKKMYPKLIIEVPHQRKIDCYFLMDESDYNEWQAGVVEQANKGDGLGDESPLEWAARDLSTLKVLIY